LISLAIPCGDWEKRTEASCWYPLEGLGVVKIVTPMTPQQALLAMVSHGWGVFCGLNVAGDQSGVATGDARGPKRRGFFGFCRRQGFPICLNFRTLAAAREALGEKYHDLIEESRTDEMTKLEKEDYMFYRGLTKHEKTSIAKAYKQDGLVEGEAIGRANEKKDIAKGMLAKGMDVALISELTKLSVEDVSALKEELKLN